MKLQQLIVPSRVYTGLTAADVPGGLEAVAQRMAPELGLSTRLVVAALLDRERLGSTSVGDGFAIPHCKVAGVNGIAVALGRFTDGLPFNPGDEDPVRFLFVVLSPPDQPAAHLQVLSQIARVLKRRELRRALLEAPGPAEVVEVLQTAAAAEGL